MQTVVFVIILLIYFNFLLKQTYCKSRVVIFFSVVCALFLGLMWSYAIEQSKSQITYWLSDAQLMLDTSVILSMEVCVNIAFCMLAAHIMTTGKLPKRTLLAYRILRFFPGLLIFPVLFSTLVAVMLSFPGRDFSTTAWITAAIALIVIPIATFGLKRVLPEKELRLEVFFITNAATAILGIVATVNGRTAVSGINETNIDALFGLIVILLIGFLLGAILYKHKIRKIISKSKKT